MSKKLRKYTAEFKKEAVKLALNSPSISATAQELGVPEPTLYYWVSKLKQVRSTGKASGGQAVTQQDIATLLEENRRLAKENARLKQEKDILKKAAAYFARESE